MTLCLHRTGTWNITAHYEGDEENAASREFKVQKFGKLLIYYTFSTVCMLLNEHTYFVMLTHFYCYSPQFYQVLR